MHINIYTKKIDLRLNFLSWAIFVTFLCVTLVMQDYSSIFAFEGCLFSLPIILLIMYWSEKKAYLLKKSDFELTKTNKFQRDFFVTAFFMNTGNLVSLLFQYNNSDARAIWPLFIYFGFFCSIIFSLLFAMISYILPTHKIYKFIFSFIIFIMFSLSKFWPYYVFVPYIGKTSFLIVTLASLVLMHLIFSFTINLVNAIISKFKL